MNVERILLSAENINKSYGHSKILNQVHFHLEKGEVLGLVGENGAGKSTLLKILSGVIPPDSGVIYWENKEIKIYNPLDATMKGIGMVFQEQNLIPMIPVFENMFLGRQPSRFLQNKKEMVRICEKMFAELGINVEPTVQTGTLPLGTRQLLEIAKAFIQTKAVNGHRVILLDEPTEALSKNQIDHFFNIIRKTKNEISYILVSHRLNETIAICDRLIAMKDGEIVTSIPVTQKTTEDEIHQLMVGRVRDKAFYQEDLQRERGSQEILKVERLTLEGAYEDVSLEIGEGEIVGLAGMIGSGRSELCRTISGILKPNEGRITFLGEDVTGFQLTKLIRKGLCYIPPERKEEGVILPHSIKWNLSLVFPPQYHRSRIINLKKEAEQSVQLMKRLWIKGRDIHALLQELSGGNQQKVALGKWLANYDIRLIIVEEPTRGIDVGAKQEIYKLFRELTHQNISFLISTENLLELIGLCNRIVVMKDGKVTANVYAPTDQKPHEVDIVKYMV